MKNIFFLVFASLLLLPFSNVSALDSVLVSRKAELLEKYISEHKQNVEKITKKYEIKNNTQINLKISELSELILGIRKLQKSNVTEQEGEEILKKVVDRMKVINSDLEMVLRLEKETFERKLHRDKERYRKLSARIHPKIDEVIKIFEDIPDKSANFGSREKQIIVSTSNLKRESERLKKFYLYPFKNSEEMKLSFLRILRNTKKELITLKKLR